MKQLYNWVISLPTMAFLFLVLAFAMAIATFVESSYGSVAAYALVYNAWWFELIWLFLVLNLSGNILRLRLYRIERLPMFLFHVSFIVILAGSAITRYVGFEGIMHIREGESAGAILSSSTYIYAAASGNEVAKKVYLSEISSRQFNERLKLENGELRFRSAGYVANAVKTPVQAAKGIPVIDLVVSSPHLQGMQALALESGERLDLYGISIGFNTEIPSDIAFLGNGDQLYVMAGDTLSAGAMGAQQSDIVLPGDTALIGKMHLYNYGDYRFLVRNYFPSATYMATKSTQGNTGVNAVVIQVSDGNSEMVIPVFGRQGEVPDTVTASFNGTEVKLAYGARLIPLPFSMKLNEFILERYPGSESPASYASEVTLVDHHLNLQKDYRIFMNNTLLYRGYKFFQSSYDRDEKGTVLSVNHDMWGTWITYIGYFLMTLGMMLSLMNPKSHFQHLARRLKGLSASKTALASLLFFATLNAGAQPGTAASVPPIDKKVVEQFGGLWVQGYNGRIEPVSTLAGEVVRKVSRKQKLYGKTAEEAFLSMMVHPEMWQQLPFVKVANKTLAAQLGARGSYLSLMDLFDQQGHYKIAEQVKMAYAKAPALRNRVDKEYIYLDERVNICFMVFRGSMLAVFPDGDTSKPWMPPGTQVSGLPAGDSLFIQSGLKLMFQSVAKGDIDDALQIIGAVGVFQQKTAPHILPSHNRKRAEIAYNRFNIFERIFPWYLLTGFVLLFVLFVNIFRMKLLHPVVKYVFYGLVIFLFAAHTAGLVARWYIAGHAPWSNGYESIVYVAWVALLAGLIFGWKYPMVVGTSAFLSGISLFVAHLSWMNPAITNLVPVLNSYWLIIHVAIITGSYGFIGLSAFLGILGLTLIALRNRINGQKVTLILEQLTTINEMSATVGLYFLTIGTFLGAIWANESWGRYWGWDPKETWSLITIVIYSFVVHMRLIPSLKGVYNYNVASTLAFLSVLMTYFGVNYYLTGLHSYGSGTSSGIHWSALLFLGLLCVLMIIALIQDNRLNENKG